MWVEDQNFQEIARSVYNKSKDGELSTKEQEELIWEYECEKSEVQEETCSGLQKLQDYIEVTQEALWIGKNNVKVLQNILWYSWSNVDGIFWPGTSTKYLLFRSEMSEGIPMKNLVEIEENFKKMSPSERKNIQRKVWAKPDGYFWPNTFKAILKNYDLVRTEFWATQEEAKDIKADEEKLPQVSEIKDEILPDNVAPWDGEPSEETVLENDTVLYEWHNYKEWEKIFEEKYGEFTEKLEWYVGLPGKVIQAIVRKESTYWANLFNSSWSKGLMALTYNPFQDMRWDTWEGKKQDSIKVLEYQAIFRKIDFNDLLSNDNSIPNEIKRSLKNIQESEDIPQIQSDIEKLMVFLKDDNSHFNHKLNMIVWAIYFSHVFHNISWWNLGQSLYNYNGNSRIDTRTWNEERVDYKRITLNYIWELQDGNKDFVWDDINDGFSRAKIRKAANWIHRRVPSDAKWELVEYFWWGQKNDIELAKLVMNFQKTNSLSPIDGMPWAWTLDKIKELEKNK